MVLQMKRFYLATGKDRWGRPYIEVGAGELIGSPPVLVSKHTLTFSREPTRPWRRVEVFPQLRIATAHVRETEIVLQLGTIKGF